MAYVTMHERKALINMLSRSKTPKTQQVEGFMEARITNDSFSRHRPGWLFCARENFAYSSSFVKVSVFVKNISPWSHYYVAM